MISILHSVCIFSPFSIPLLSQIPGWNELESRLLPFVHRYPGVEWSLSALVPSSCPATMMMGWRPWVMGDRSHSPVFVPGSSSSSSSFFVHPIRRRRGWRWRWLRYGGEWRRSSHCLSIFSGHRRRWCQFPGKYRRVDDVEVFHEILVHNALLAPPRINALNC